MTSVGQSTLEASMNCVPATLKVCVLGMDIFTDSAHYHACHANILLRLPHLFPQDLCKEVARSAADAHLWMNMEQVISQILD